LLDGERQRKRVAADVLRDGAAQVLDGHVFLNPRMCAEVSAKAARIGYKCLRFCALLSLFPTTCRCRSAKR
jgi:hypothetical protein